MNETVYCLDSGVLIKFLTLEEPAELSKAASHVVLQAISNGRLVAPAFAWAEVGSVLRKKVRQRVLSPKGAEQSWSAFTKLPIEYFDVPDMRERAWEIAEAFQLVTLYDAAFLACVEVASGSSGTAREFWTTDEALVRSLGHSRPAYVR